MENKSNAFTASPINSEDNTDFSNQNNFPQKGIFHPESNIFICKVDCCCKYIGLFIVLYGLFFGIVFPLIGILNDLIIFTIFGSVIFLACLIAAIYVFCSVTLEVKFTFSHPMVGITITSMCGTKKQFVEKKEITEIFFEFTETGTEQKGAYQALHIKFNNGIENIYFKMNSTPPCFTKNEVDYFNNEMKELLSYDYNLYY